MTHSVPGTRRVHVREVLIEPIPTRSAAAGGKDFDLLSCTQRVPQRDDDSINFGTPAAVPDVGVVQPVREFAEDDPDILNHRKQQPSKRFDLLLMLTAVTLVTVKTVYHVHLRQVIQRNRGIFHDIAQNGCHQRLNVYSQTLKNVGNRQWVGDIRFTGCSFLTFVRGRGHFTGTSKSVDFVRLAFARQCLQPGGPAITTHGFTRLLIAQRRQRFNPQGQPNTSIIPFAASLGHIVHERRTN